MEFALGTFLFAAAGWTSVFLPFELANGETARKHLPATTTGGLAVFDFDGDGILDIFFANGGELPSGKKTKPAHANTLLRGKGDFTFEDVTAKAGVAGTEYSFGASAADFDQDGDIDLLVTGLRGIVLYSNQGDGTFRDVTASAGLDNKGRWAVAAVWLDVENDGDLDLFVVNYVKWDSATERECKVNGKPDFCHPRFYAAQSNALFLNDGKGRFTDASASSGIESHPGKGMSVAAADFDGDGLTDLFVTNDRLFASYFRNIGGGKFKETAFEVGVAVPEDGKPVSGMGVDAQDFDNDGRIDIVYSALRDETFPLLKNRGKDFVEVTSRSRLNALSRRHSGWGIVFADIDNDGWLDIASVTSDALSPDGGRGEQAKERPAWFRNRGDGTFEAGVGWEQIEPQMFRGAVAADMNRDGCLDIVYSALNARAGILVNPCKWGNGSIKVNGAKLGSTVKVGAQMRNVSSATGYASSYAGPVVIGIGKSMVSTVQVGDQILGDIAPNTIVRVPE